MNRPAPPVYRPTGRIRCAQLPVRRQARRLRFTKLHGQLWRWRFSRKALLRQECRGAKSRYGNFLMAEPTGSHGFDPTEFTGVPIIIEVPVPAKDVEAARDKVNRLVGTGRHRTQAVAFVFEVNSRLTIDSKDKDDFKVSTVSDHTANAKLAELNAVCRALAAHMESNGLFGGCFPMVFVPTGPEGGYTFPFLESRSILTRHTGVQLVHQAMRELAKEVGFPPVVRGMDNDVSQDPLLNLPEKAPEVPEGTPEVEAQRLKLQARASTKLSTLLSDVSSSRLSMFSGGYNWNPANINEAKLTQLEITPAQGMIPFLRRMVNEVNKSEHLVRTELAKTVYAKSIYYPEPNVYMGLDLRASGTKAQEDEANSLKLGSSQQKESTHYAKLPAAKSGMHVSLLTTYKPLKDYFDDFLKYFAKVFSGTVKPSKHDIIQVVTSVRQSHLDIGKVKGNLEWHGVDVDKEVPSQVFQAIELNANKVGQERLTTCADTIFNACNLLHPAVMSGGATASASVHV